MNNDFTIAMDMARKLMDSGIPFMEAVCQGLDESGTIDRWKREKAGKPRKHKVRGCFKPGDCTPHTGNRSDALQLIEKMRAELNHIRPRP